MQEGKICAEKAEAAAKEARGHYEVAVQALSVVEKAAKDILSGARSP